MKAFINDLLTGPKLIKYLISFGIRFEKQFTPEIDNWILDLDFTKYQIILNHVNYIFIAYKTKPAKISKLLDLKLLVALF